MVSSILKEKQSDQPRSVASYKAEIESRNVEHIKFVMSMLEPDEPNKIQAQLEYDQDRAAAAEENLSLPEKILGVVTGIAFVAVLLAISNGFAASFNDL